MPQKKPAGQSQELMSEGIRDAQENLEPTQEEIARLAYELWEARGCGHGRDQEDWLEAEQLLGRPKVQSNAA